MVRRGKAIENSDASWLAEWLDLSRYEAAKEFEPYKWGMQLQARAALLENLKEGKAAKFHERFCEEVKTEPLALGNHNFVLPNPNAVPIRDLGHLDLPLLQTAYELNSIAAAVAEWNKKNPADWRSRVLNAGFVAGNVSSIGQHPLYGVEIHPMMLSMCSGEACRSEEKELTDESSDAPLEPEECKPVEAFVDAMTSGAFVRVNMNLDDKVLLRYFEKWLRERRNLLSSLGVTHLERPTRRAHGGESRRLRLLPSDGLRWHSLRILPYIDIRIRAMIEHRKMPTASTIAEFLFPRQAKNELHVRNKVAVQASRLLRRETYSRLLDQGLWEFLTSS